MKLTPQERKVYDYLKAHPGATTHDITRDTFVQKPCARITDLKAKGVEIETIGEVRYPGTKAFCKYAIKTGLKRRVSKYQFDPVRNCMVEVVTEVEL